MQGIYKIENLIDGKCYVGQSIDIEKRWANHKYILANKNDKNHKYHLYRAMRKHGIENFRFSVLEEVELRDDLTPRELYWYSELDPEYNNLRPDYINEGSYNPRAVALIDLDTNEILAEYESISQAARENKLGITTIWKHCNCKVRYPKYKYR